MSNKNALGTQEQPNLFQKGIPLALKCVIHFSEKWKKAKLHSIRRKQDARACSKVGVSKVLVAMLAVLFLFCVALFILIPYIAAPKVEITAEKLSSIPEQYFVVTEGDPVLLQAISQLGKPVSVNSLAETEIDNWIKDYGTNNLKFQENYYKVYIPIVDPSEIYAQILWLALFGAIVSGIALIVIIMANKLEKRKQ